MALRLGVLVFLFVVVVSAAGVLQFRDTGPAREDVTGVEAERMLGRAVELVRSGQASNLCEELEASEQFCQVWLSDDGYGKRVPTEAPRIVESAAAGDTNPWGQGWILTLEGVDGAGEPYRHEFYVMRRGPGELAAPYPVYWRPLRIRESSP